MLVVEINIDLVKSGVKQITREVRGEAKNSNLSSDQENFQE